MADLGRVLLDELGGDEDWDDYDDPDEWQDDVLELYGSVSRASRELGVPRSTLRGWLAGRNPKRGRSWFSGLLRGHAARSGMSPDREARLRSTSVEDIRVSGTYSYAGGQHMRGAEDRDVPIGHYLDQGVMGALVDAYLDGASADELGAIFAEHVNDGGFYADTFAGRDGGHWDIHWVEGLGL